MGLSSEIYSPVRGVLCMSLNLNGFSFVLIACMWALPFLVSLYAVKLARAAWALPAQAKDSTDSRLRLLAESHEEMREVVDRLADQVKMANVRAKLTHGTRKAKADEEPNATTDPDAWRQWMNRKLNRQKAGLE